MKPLSELKIDEEGIVADSRGLNRRLKALGIVRGAKIKCVLKSPLGDPKAYKICGAVIALREDDASRVMVEALLRDGGGAFA